MHIDCTIQILYNNNHHYHQLVLSFSLFLISVKSVFGIADHSFYIWEKQIKNHSPKTPKTNKQDNPRIEVAYKMLFSRHFIYTAN